METRSSQGGQVGFGEMASHAGIGTHPQGVGVGTDLNRRQR